MTRPVNTDAASEARDRVAFADLWAVSALASVVALHALATGLRRGPSGGALVALAGDRPETEFSDDAAFDNMPV